MLSDPGSISDTAVTILKGVTVGKLVFVTAAFVQTLVLAAIAAYKAFAASM
jgi:acetyltransferase-like isoleucine patch superfamily enzyme